MLPSHEREALNAVLSNIATPNAEDAEFSYFLQLSKLFEASGYQSQVIRFCKAAIQVAPDDTDTAELWFKVFRGHVALNEFEEAYMALVATPHEKL